MLEGSNIIVLDLETANSADEVENGWRNKLGLGLSIGGYYDYQTERVQFFDPSNLLATVSDLVARQCLMVSYNGVQFDFALMRALLRHGAETTNNPGIGRLCDSFKDLALRSYNILQQIWSADPERRYEPGLNSLDAVAKANQLGNKTGDGVQAPKDWQAGLYAKVVNYCCHDIYLTKHLFELLLLQQGRLQRSNGALQIESPKIYMENLGIRFGGK